MTCHVGISSGPTTVLARTNYACGQLHVSVCVCFLLWSDFSFRIVFIHLLSAPQLSHVWLCLHCAPLFVWIKPIVHLLFRHLSMTVLTCWSPSLSPAPLLHGPDAGDGAHQCQEPWFSQTAGWEPGTKHKWSENRKSTKKKQKQHTLFLLYHI